MHGCQPKQRTQEELEALRQQGLEQELVYSYLACMTVRARDRRKGIATALLRAAEIQAGPSMLHPVRV